MKKYVAEMIGTFTLVFFGVGTAVLAGAGVGLADAVSITGISLAFGISVIAMAYSIGQISGAHLNPAVSLGCFVAGRMTRKDLAGYVIAQVIGGLVATTAIYTIVMTKSAGYDMTANGLGQNGWGPGFGGAYGLVGAFLFEVIATAIFVITVLGVTSGTGNPNMAGLVIGLTLAMTHLVGINITGNSVNPARSIGPALFVGGQAISQVWLFIAAPAVGAVIAGFLHKSGITSSSTT